MPSTPTQTPTTSTGRIRAAEFARVARVLGATARQLGLIAPAFRTPPAGAELRRSLRRYRDGSAMVSVHSHERPAVEVVDDLVEGVVVTNRLAGLPAARLRVALWEAVAADSVVGAGDPPARRRGAAGDRAAVAA